MSNELNTNVRRADTWKRGLFILIFAVIYSIAEVVLGAIVLFQFGSQLFTGRTNDKLYGFSRGLTAYFYQLVQFFTYRSDLKPFPFSEWPDDGLESVQEQENEMQQAAQPAKDEEQPQPVKTRKPAKPKTARTVKTAKTAPPAEPAEPAEPPTPASPDEDVRETKE